MKPIQEIKKEINEDFEKGATKCVENIVHLMKKERLRMVNERVKKGVRKNTEVEETMKFSNKDIENLDIFFEKTMIALLYKGYIMKKRDVVSDGEHIIEVYLNKGKKGSEKYFENIKKNTDNSAYDNIQTYEKFARRQFAGQAFADDKTIVNCKLDEITETIRQTLVHNAQNNQNVTEVTLKYDIPNEGDKPLEYYCENDNVLDSIVKELKDSGYECKTEVKSGLLLKTSEQLSRTIKDGYHYRNVVVKW